MSLYEQLRDILSSGDVLPTDPAEAILGSELLETVREKLDGEYSDNSIRQTFSALASDPTSPLARVEQGYGYYRRAKPDVPPTIPRTSKAEGFGPATPALGDGRDGQPEEKFRAFYLRHARLKQGFPLHVEHTSGLHQSAGVNKWKFPDVVVLDWEVAEQRDDGFALDRALLEVKRSLGEQPFRLTSVELKVELSLSTFREHFFQCVSNSKWAHVAQLIVATPVTDSVLVGELRRLGASYGVAILYFQLSRERLDTLPSASRLMAMSDDEFEKLATGLVPVSVATGTPRSELDWDHIRDMRQQSPDFRNLFDWIARCLRDSRPYSFDNFQQLLRIEGKAS